jgi:DNA-binding NtrC family response regulator
LQKRIIIIEDDIEMCRELTEILTDLGYGISYFSDGRKGKKAITRNRFDLMILDLKLPGCNGYQILELIQKKKINIKVIVITARMKIDFEDIIKQNNDPYLDELLQTAHHILKKPFKIPNLIDYIQTSLQS